MPGKGDGSIALARSQTGTEWPFAGRADELHAVVSACTGGNNGVVVVGEAGVGRTRLAQEALKGLESAGAAVEWVTATRAAAAIPFGAVVHLLPGSDRREADRLTLFRRAIDRYRARSTREVLVVDDVHLLDDESAAMVHHLVTHDQISVLLTVAAGQDAPDAIRVLWKDGVIAWLELDPLAPAALDEVIEQALGGPLDGLSRRELHRLSMGNPLLLRELMESGLETGALKRCLAGMWRYRGLHRRTPRLTPADAAGVRQCWDLLWDGKPGDAAKLAEEGYRQALDLGAAPWTAGWSVVKGAVAKAQGQVTAAVHALSEAIALLDGYDPGRLTGLCFAELAGVFAVSGDRAEAEAFLEHVDVESNFASAGSVLRDTRTRGASAAELNFAPLAELDRAWTAAVAGDTATAVAHAKHAATLAEEHTVAAMALYDAARLGDPAGVRRDLAELADILRRPAPRAMSLAACGLADENADALDKATATFVELGLYLLAAETATAAAAIHRRERRVVQANRSAERAVAARRWCPQARTPLLRLGDSAIGLTNRERDVTLLAAAGLTSQAIARRLRLSVRTVDNHLGRVYTKLGVVGRHELGPLLGQDTGISPL